MRRFAAGHSAFAPPVMGQSGSRAGGNDGQSNEERKEKKKSKYEQPAPTRVGKKKKKKPGPAPSAKVPTIVPASKCKLRLLKLERVKDYLLMEEEFVARQEQVKPQEETASTASGLASKGTR